MLPDRLRDRAKRALVLAAWLAFAVKAIVPVGYMPAPLSGGSPFMLCDGVHGMPMAGHHARSNPGDANGAAAKDQWKHCPLGALASAAGLAGDLPPQLADPGQESFLALDITPLHTVPCSVGFCSRAPPLTA